MIPKPKTVPFRRVHVTWRDAESDTTWMDRADLIHGTRETETMPNESLGWIVHQDKHWLVIAASVAWNGDWLFNNISRIPRGMVLKVTRI